MLKNKSKGITLISLVITVVVLLILAGVAVSITADEDGIFGKAGKASKETQIARDKDALWKKICYQRNGV